MHLAPVLAYINYYLAHLLGCRDLDFLDMGLGIQARYKRCGAYWQRHIKNCTEIQQQLFQRLPTGSKISILGAGRCLDLNLDAAAEFEHALKLFDADRGCLPYWKELKRKRRLNLQWEICELSNCLYFWSDSLKQYLRNPRQHSIESLSKFFIELRAPEPVRIGQADAVISLNILSQLPLFWRDRLQYFIQTFVGLETDERGRYPDPLQSAVEQSYRILQEQHLQLLEFTQAHWILIFYDKQFEYLRANNCNWQQEKSLYISEDQLLLSGFSVYDQSSWHWDIAPQGVEQTDYSQVHRVNSLMLKRRK